MKVTKDINEEKLIFSNKNGKEERHVRSKINIINENMINKKKVKNNHTQRRNCPDKEVKNNKMQKKYKVSFCLIK